MAIPLSFGTLLATLPRRQSLPALVRSVATAVNTPTAGCLSLFCRAREKGTVLVLCISRLFSYIISEVSLFFFHPPFAAAALACGRVDEMC